MSGLPHKVLFVCIHNSARSQMAEAFLNKYGRGQFLAESAGIEPGKMNPNVVQVMLEAGINLSHKNTKGVFDLLEKGNSYNTIVTVCDRDSADKCPIFPGTEKKITWSFEDPSLFNGSREEILEKTREVRDEIEKAIQNFISESGRKSD